MHGMRFLLAQVSLEKHPHEIVRTDQVSSVLPGPTLTISEEDLRLIGKYSSANATVKIPERYGGGYLATLEVFHNLHCLVRLVFLSRS